MNDPDEKAPYQAESEGQRFHVIDGDGKVLIVCGDAANAQHYAVLMNQAYRRGYRAGFRQANSARH